jgi:hypothetical protein
MNSIRNTVRRFGIWLIRVSEPTRDMTFSADAHVISAAFSVPIATAQKMVLRFGFDGAERRLRVARMLGFAFEDVLGMP